MGRRENAASVGRGKESWRQPIRLLGRHRSLLKRMRLRVMEHWPDVLLVPTHPCSSGIS